MNSVYLILRADDFGLCHAANQAIGEAFETGLLSCASLTAAGPWVAEAAALARAHPEWEIGQQLSLTCTTAGCRWGPVAGAAAVPSLVEQTGTFLPALSPAATADDITREFHAQVERARAWGITPAYLEYTGNAHPAVDAVMQRLSQQFGLPARMTAWGVQPILLPPPGVCVGTVEQARVTSLRDALGTLGPGVHLWIAHPAHDSPEAWAFWDAETAQARQADMSALCSPEVKALIRQKGIELIGFRQYVEMRLETAPLE